MTLIVEDGSIVAGAESYISAADAQTYLKKRGLEFQENTAVLEGALRKATDYMIQTYRQRWQGFKVSGTQPLDWPRNSVYVDPVNDIWGKVTATLIPNHVVPDEVKYACAELAFKSLSEDLLEDQDRPVISEQIDKIKIDYDKFAPLARKYKAIDFRLAPFLAANNNSIQRTLRR